MVKPISYEALAAHTTVATDPEERVYLWHAHVYYNHLDPNARASVEAFKSAIDKRFEGDEQVQVAKAIRDAPGGPHTQPDFKITFVKGAFEKVLLFLSLNRPADISIIVHPITKSEVADHSKYAIWLGKQWDIKYDVLRRSDEAGSKMSEEDYIWQVEAGGRPPK